MAVNQTYSPRGLGYKSELNIESTSYMLWRKIADIPVIRNWKVASDAAFLATGLPTGIAYFVVAVTGLAAGVPLTFLGVGLLILAAMFAAFGILGKVERARLNALGDAGVPASRESTHVKGGIVKQAVAYLTSGSLHRELFYGAIMFPLAIAELALVTLPLTHMMAIFTQPIFGSVQPGIGGWTVNNPLEALISFGFGVILIVPVAFACNIVARLHRELARTLLG